MHPELQAQFAAAQRKEEVLTTQLTWIDGVVTNHGKDILPNFLQTVPEERFFTEVEHVISLREIAVAHLTTHTRPHVVEDLERVSLNMRGVNRVAEAVERGILGEADLERALKIFGKSVNGNKPNKEADKIDPPADPEEEKIATIFSRIGDPNQVTIAAERKILTIFMEATRERRRITRDADINSVLPSSDATNQVYISNLKRQFLEPRLVTIASDRRDQIREEGPSRYWLELMTLVVSDSNGGRPDTDTVGKNPNLVNFPSIEDEEERDVLRRWDVRRVENLLFEKSLQSETSGTTGVVPLRVLEHIMSAASAIRSGFRIDDVTDENSVTGPQFLQANRIVVNYMSDQGIPDIVALNAHMRSRLADPNQALTLSEAEKKLS